MDLWWSGKHRCHGGNIQVITAPDGWPLWSSPVRPGREHDLTCARAHPGLLDGLAEFIDDDHAVLADLGYEGESDRLTVPIKTRSGVQDCSMFCWPLLVIPC
ncbi:transposase family protein [Pseudonocardia sp. ICBG1142]|uniref:transposase family protein n=1 Tax=Pseudonocardia sp. ICBG1142 TaxID=2846760 RepID=UPI0035A981A3